MLIISDDCSENRKWWEKSVRLARAKIFRIPFSLLNLLNDLAFMKIDWTSSLFRNPS